MTTKIMTYNIRYDTPDDEIRSWSARKGDVVERIQNNQPDILGLQEVLVHQLADIKNIPFLKNYQFVFLAREDGIELGEFNGLCYNPEKFSEVEHEMFWLSETPDTPSKHPDAGCYRVCVLLKLKEIETGKVFVAAVTHLDNLSVSARAFGIELIMQRLVPFAKDLPVFLMGDFNMEPTDDAFHKMDGLLKSTRDLAATVQHYPGGTCQDELKLFTKDSLYPIEIDFIMTNLNKGINSYFVDETKGTDDFYPSDHFPVIIEADL